MQFDDVGPALAVGSDADRDVELRSLLIRCGMDVAKHKMACRRSLRQVFCAFGDFGIGEALHPKVPWRRSSPCWESVRIFSSKQLGDAGPALAVGSDADRDAALRSLFIRCGMDIAKHKSLPYGCGRLITF
ncbi:hypothetical protein D3P07_20095 [Paenibacillus sp. 1011MAR3C5]|nr:hypothetical protein D3P07_20095 [Paenibacillus sp. 1011MAR3C5]